MLVTVGAVSRILEDPYRRVKLRWLLAVPRASAASTQGRGWILNHRTMDSEPSMMARALFLKLGSREMVAEGRNQNPEEEPAGLTPTLSFRVGC